MVLYNDDTLYSLSLSHIFIKGRDFKPLAKYGALQWWYNLLSHIKVIISWDIKDSLNANQIYWPHWNNWSFPIPTSKTSLSYIKWIINHPKVEIKFSVRFANWSHFHPAHFTMHFDRSLLGLVVIATIPSTVLSVTAEWESDITDKDHVFRTMMMMLLTYLIIAHDGSVTRSALAAD